MGADGARETTAQSGRGGEATPKMAGRVPLNPNRCAPGQSLLLLGLDKNLLVAVGSSSNHTKPQGYESETTSRLNGFVLPNENI